MLEKLVAQARGKKTYLVVLAYVALKVAEGNGWITPELSATLVRDVLMPAGLVTVAAKLNRVAEDAKAVSNTLTRTR